MHESDVDYTSQHIPDEDAIERMSAQAFALSNYLQPRPRYRYPSEPPVIEETPHGWVQYNPQFPLTTAIMIDPPSIPITHKTPITDAIQREKAYADAKFEQRRGGGVGLQTADRDAIEAHVKDLERIANDIELRRTGSDVIQKAVDTLRLASLGFVRACSLVGGDQ